ncbi:M28 family peptidase [Oscillatoria sp. FACHB-1407]|uniref:M28 family peptidase n=1 Tax=Oscillatoria sp. FACHB-1407 TaxID=2692847 RepID=UPI0016844AD0|nr:M28 family peptidase [Oscillatoria sp. FACHB-1407]MBD2464342.1 M28 family peptidase [Oscillatoria sp. FACHB-1407]
MRKLGIWLTLCVVTAIGIVIGWNWHTIYFQPQALETSYDPGSVAQAEVAVVAPAVDGDRLWADLEQLNFRRFTESERDQARRYIVQQLTDAGWTPQFQEFDGGINIYAERPGTDPSAGTILLGAHYDSVEQSAGVDDNATGVAAVLEAARLLGDRSTPRTLKLALFDLEEVGLLGSFAFAKDATRIEQLQGAIVLDMIGFACHTDGCQSYPAVLPFTPATTRGDFLAVIGDQGHMPLIDAFSRAARRELPTVLTLPVPLLGPFTPDLLRSDHAPFWQAGIGAVLLTDTANFRNPHYHTETDTLENVDRPFFTGSSQIVINAVTQLLHSRNSMATQSVPQRSQSTPARTTRL